MSNDEFLKWRNLVISIAIKYTAIMSLDGSTIDDIIQIGSIGLLQAYNSYDETKGPRAMYYKACIRYKILDTIKTYNFQNRKANIKTLSTQAPMSNDYDETIEDTLQDDTDIEAQVIDKLLLDQMLKEFKSILKEKEYNIFILKVMEQYTFQQIANIYKCSRQAIEQCYKRIKAKLIENSELLKEITIERYFKKLSELEQGSSAYMTTPETYVLSKMYITDSLVKKIR